ncbi:40S ribosomal protein S29-like [Panthera uncia]|uniref:40S ribosomal protein S29-like n=1 Tax=Panthera uncia TaxID=29064 RepID=UPI0020FF9B70|nr:40S ribosomal protein S29-like [Panthera uncia]
MLKSIGLSGDHGLVTLPHCIPESKMGHQQLYWSRPRKSGEGSHSCHIYSNWHSLIWKYSLTMCHHHFRQYAKDKGFIKFD